MALGSEARINSLTGEEEKKYFCCLGAIQMKVGFLKSQAKKLYLIHLGIRACIRIHETLHDSSFYNLVTCFFV